MGGYGGPSRGPPLEEKVPLRHRKDGYRLAREQLAVSSHLVGLRVHLDPRQRVVVNHIALTDRAAPADRDHTASEAQTARHVLRERRLRDERDGCGGPGAAEGTEHRAVTHWLGRRDRGVGVSHRRPRDDAALDDQLGLDAEERSEEHTSELQSLTNLVC